MKLQVRPPNYVLRLVRRLSCKSTKGNEKTVFTRMRLLGWLLQKKNHLWVSHVLDPKNRVQKRAAYAKVRSTKTIYRITAWNLADYCAWECQFDWWRVHWSVYWLIDWLIDWLIRWRLRLYPANSNGQNDLLDSVFTTSARFVLDKRFGYVVCIIGVLYCPCCGYCIMRAYCRHSLTRHARGRSTVQSSRHIWVAEWSCGYGRSE